MKRLPIVPPSDLPGRREVLQWLGVGAAVLFLPACGPKPTLPPEPPKRRFLTDDEAITLGALADVVLPPDADFGGKQLGTVTYVDRLLSLFDGPDAPALFAGGPYSGRQPFVATDGTPSQQFPENDFAKFLPLDRVAERAWRIYLYGEEGPNDAVLGTTKGLRDRVRAGLAKARDLAGKPLDQLSPEDVATVFRGLDRELRDDLVALVSEAAFSAPEYGGNTDGEGWRMVHYEGDAMPLGYSLWSESAGKYLERADAPMSTANPGPDPAPLDDETRQFLTDIVTLLGGKEFGS